MDEDGSIHCRLVVDEPTNLMLHKTTQRVFRGTGKLSLGKPPAEFALDCRLTGSPSREIGDDAGKFDSHLDWSPSILGFG
jgi:hypothetical protein